MTLLNLSLDTRAGYTWDVKQYFSFRGERRLCGTHGYPGGTPRTLYVVSK